MRSPTTWKRKWPDSITPAWIGPTATWYGSLAAHGHRPAREVGVVVDERAQRLVAVEADRRRGRAPRARPSPAAGARSTIVGTRLPRLRPSRAGRRRRRRRAASGRASRPRSRGARRSASRRRAPPRSRRGTSSDVDGHRTPLTSASTIALPGSQNAARASASRTPGRDAERGHDAQARRVGAVAAVRLAAGRLDQRVREPEEARARAAPRRTAAAQGRPAWKPPATISTSLTKQRRRRQPGEGAERDADATRRARAACARFP